MSLFHKHTRQEADAAVTHVKMVRRVNYGTAICHVTYSVQPSDGPAFELVREAKVKMATLPQAGQLVRVNYDPDRPDRFDVLTPPGQETGAVTERTIELPYSDRRMPYASESEMQHLRERVHAEAEDPLLGKLKELGELRDSGVLTAAEFEAQKARLLAEQ